LIISAAAVAALLIGSTSITLAKFTSESESTQGNSGKENLNANPNNEGQTTTTGPKGQIKQDDKCHNCTESPPDLPGANR
jgi:hypothetical protein